MKHNGKEYSPCIVAKARFALGLSDTKPKNKKTCSEEYWNEVIDILLERNKGYPYFSSGSVQAARNYTRLFKKH